MRSFRSARSARATFTGMAAALALALVSPPALAVTNGKIVFQRGFGAFNDVPYNRGGQLYLTDPSTYSPTAGTVTEALFGDGSQPHVSPDGTKIVFIKSVCINVTSSTAYSPVGLVVPGGGSNLPGLYPKLSPDATQVAYQNVGSTGKVSIVNVACTSGHEYDTTVCNSTKLDASSAASNLEPAWNPVLTNSGGNRTGKIVFVRKAAPTDATGDIFVTTVTIAPNGVVTEGSTTNLTNSPAAYSFPAYSPNGQYIFFGRDTGLWMMRADGTGSHQIVHDTGTTLGLLSGNHPVFSPDGTKIAFDNGDAFGQIYVGDITIAADGTATAHNVTAMSGLNGTADADEYPAWLPGAAPGLTLKFEGRLRDRVGRGDAALAPDGESDGIFTVTMPAAGSYVTRLQLCQQAAPCTSAPTTVNRWDTVPANNVWVIGVADALDTPLLNQADGSINLQFGSTFEIFVPDALPSAFVQGAPFTLTAIADSASISGTTTLTATAVKLADVGVQYSPRPPASAMVGDLLTYNVLVRNVGPDTASAVVVSDTLPSTLEFVPASSSSSCSLAGGKVSCSLGDIPAGSASAMSGPSVRTVAIAARALQAGTITNSFRADAASPSDPYSGNDSDSASTTVQVRPAIVLIGLEVTQGIQDLANSVPLVAGKHTFVRAYVKAANAASEGALISATLTAKNAMTGAVIGTMANSNVGGKITTKQNPDRGVLDDSFYFEVPFGLYLGDTDWTQGLIEYTFALNGAGATLSCAEPDSSPDCKVAVAFQGRQPLRVKFVTTTWTDTAGKKHVSNIGDALQTVAELGGIYPISAIDAKLGASTTALNPCSTANQYAEFSQIKGEIAKLRQTDCAAGPCESVYLGLLADQATCGVSSLPLNGMATFPSPDPDPALSWGRAALAFVKRNSIGTNTSPTSPLMDANARAHELSHCTGNHHTYTAGELGPDPNYVPANGDISSTTDPYAATTAYGFDINQVSASRIYGPTTKDFMSYSRPRWVSVYNYKKLFAFFSPANSNAVNRPGGGLPEVQADRLLLVSGSVSTTTGIGKLDPLTVTSAPGTATLPAAGTYAIRLEDATGAELATYSFEPNHATDDDTALISLTLPWNTGTRRVTLLHQGVAIAFRQASANPPIVTVTSPNGGEALNGASATFTWTASDADGDPLSYTVEYSADNGTTWQTLVVDWASTSYLADLSSLPGSTQALIRVTAHDGFYATQDQSDATFVVSGHAPQAAITTPEDGHQYLAGQTILLQGMGLDPKDGVLPGGSLTWTSSLNGALGNGSSLQVNASALQQGTHVITLTARDSGGQTGSAAITLVIGAAGCPAIALSPGSLPDATVGTSYSASIDAAGGTAPYAFTLTSGTLPSGLTFSNGTISGMPTESGSFPIAVSTTDSAGCTGGHAYTLVAAAASGACATAGPNLCVQSSRFSIRVDFTNQYAQPPASGVGNAAQITSDTGYFWFFNAANVELVIKVLDGRGVNGKFWVFYGALSDVEYTITVTDTQTGAVKTYHNPPGTMASFADTNAF